MIVDDSFNYHASLNTNYHSLSSTKASSVQMGTALSSSCEEQQSNNLDEYSDDSDAESEKERKAKKTIKIGMTTKLSRPTHAGSK